MLRFRLNLTVCTNNGYPVFCLLLLQVRLSAHRSVISLGNSQQLHRSQEESTPCSICCRVPRVADGYQNGQRMA